MKQVPRIYSVKFVDVRTGEPSERVAVSQVSFLRQFEDVFSILAELTDEFELTVRVRQVSDSETGGVS